MTDFAARALIDGEFALTSEQRLETTLADPNSRGALSVPVANKITLARLRYALSEFAHTNTVNVQGWLNDVASRSPERAIELYLELLQFSVPKLKAVAMEIHDTSPNPRQLSVSDLEKLASDSVVSDQ